MIHLPVNGNGNERDQSSLWTSRAPTEQALIYAQVLSLSCYPRGYSEKERLRDLNLIPSLLVLVSANRTLHSWQP